jgi:dipeptidyl aminopeptidase/acylaminoacyl peptidase
MKMSSKVGEMVGVLMVLAVCPALVAGAGEKRAMTVDDMLDLVRIDNVVMTPDGSKVFYSERRLNWEKNKYEKTLFMVPTTGGEAVPFVRKDGGESFRISPDGKYLSMLREVDDQPQVFLMDLSGGEAWQLTRHEGEITDYRWAGNGAIVFVAEEPMGEVEKKEFGLGDDPIFVNEGPNGKNHGRWTHLWRIDIESKDESRITEEDLLIDGFDVSPDGLRVIFAARPHDRGNFPFHSELFLVDTGGGNLKRLTDNQDLEIDPLWSPDGKTFVYHASSGETFDLRSGFLWIMDPDTGTVSKLEAHHTGEIDHLVWSADGESLLFNEVHGTNTNLYRLRIAADRLEALTDGEGTFRAVAYSEDRKTIAYTFNDFDTPNDLYTSGIDGSGSVRLTRANEWVESEILLPRSQVIQWRSKDGMPIEGIFMLPAGNREGTKPPLILQIHGGPDGYWANTFEPDLIIYTGLGYAVLGPNVRGSSGYGDDLLRGLMGDMGGGEYFDLMTGVDHVIAAGHVDPERMGVAGWSWGGVLGGWVITQTDRFKAASVGAGVSNWIGESGPGFNWDISNWHIGGKHWTNREEWRRRSAINFVENVTTPTLFLHGEKDQTSSTNQSMVYFDALQERGVPTRFIKFPRQKHGIREPRLLRVRIVEEVRWMQKYVVGVEWTPWTRAKCDASVQAESAMPRIVFHSDRDGNSEIYSISPSGEDETRLTFNEGFDGFPSWSPDGKSIAFQSERDRTDAIFVMKANGSDPRRVPNTENGRYPKFSPDGRSIAFFAERAENTEIVVVDADGSNPRNLTDHSATDETPSWTADGRTLAFQSDRNDPRAGDRSGEDRHPNFGIFTVTADGSGVREITGVETNDENPSISPDGRSIVYQSYMHDSLVVAAVDVESGEKKILTNPKWASGSPAWSTDGAKIVFDSNREGNFEIFVMDADGQNQRQLTFTEDAENSGAAIFVGR